MHRNRTKCNETKTSFRHTSSHLARKTTGPILQLLRLTWRKCKGRLSDLLVSITLSQLIQHTGVALISVSVVLSRQ